MWDENSIYRRIETGYAHTKVIIDEPDEKYNNQTLTKESAISKNKYYNPKNLFLQHILVKEKVKKIDVK